MNTQYQALAPAWTDVASFTSDTISITATATTITRTTAVSTTSTVFSGIAVHHAFDKFVRSKSSIRTFNTQKRFVFDILSKNRTFGG